MARRSRPSFTKRQKEMARQQKQQDKAARRLELKRQKLEQPAGADADAPGSDSLPGSDAGSKPVLIDPEIADIRPGPQPPAAWMVTPERKP